MKYLDPKADLTFKRVFGEHPDLVMSLLNALLPISVGQEITVLNIFLPKLCRIIHCVKTALWTCVARISSEGSSLLLRCR